MAKLLHLTIECYRSINEQIVIRFPENKPVVLLGENNVGKSNIVKALDILFGEQWTGSRGTEDHNHWGQRKNYRCQSILNVLASILAKRE